jgi:hypothetical protein
VKGEEEMKKKKIIIEGYTSNQEVRASAWESYGKEKVYQLACNIYESEKLAKRIYGKNGYRKVRLIMQELLAPKE